MSPPKIDRPGIYAALKVAEIWRFDGEQQQLFIERLEDDGTYRTVDRSSFLPCMPRKFVAGSSKKTPTTNPSGASSPRLGPCRGGAAVARLIAPRIGEVDRRILARSSLKLDQTPGVAQLRKTDRGG